MLYRLLCSINFLCVKMLWLKFKFWVIQFNLAVCRCKTCVSTANFGSSSLRESGGKMWYLGIIGDCRDLRLYAEKCDKFGGIPHGSDKPSNIAPHAQLNSKQKLNCYEVEITVKRLLFFFCLTPVYMTF